MTKFELFWIIFVVILLILAAGIGKRLKKEEHKGIFGILIDNRGRYSLTHFQIVLWTIVILSSVCGVLVSKGFDANNFGLSPQLLGLMGISAGSAVLATGVKGKKDVTPKMKITKNEPPELSEIWLEEEGSMGGKVVSITKFQNFIFTIVILLIYVSLAVKVQGLPVLPDNVVWLIGISHAGYVGGKVPDKK